MTPETESTWQITERAVAAERLGVAESLFAVANGYVGVRGAPEEGAPAHEPGVVLNGFHETWPIVYPEDAYGLARTGQTVVNAPDGSVVRLFVDDEPFDLRSARVRRYERTLDLQAGVLVREVEWETPGGARLLMRSRRLASLQQRHLVACDHELEVLAGTAHVTISSELVTYRPGAAGDDPRRGRALTGKVLDSLAAEAQDMRAVLTLATRNSGLELACGMEHEVGFDGAHTTEVRALDDGAAFVLQAELVPATPLRLSKFIAYHWAPDARPGDLAARVHRTLDRAAGAGFSTVQARHREVVAAFWRRSDVEVGGTPEVQRAVRFNLFQLLQATARCEGHGVPAKGLTGHGYEGHYFWDTEVYVAPFLIHTSPQWARQLLQFRCAMLPAARRRAREVGHRGALYPWRTISGDEASAWYASGTAQYHINADIAYALQQYTTVTGDLELVLDEAAEVLVETARMWMELGFFSERRGGAFCINGVTGPDEYTTVVDNNAYTNLMAAENLEAAVRVVELLRQADPPAYDRLAERTRLEPGEAAAWLQASQRMHVPRHAESGIVLQDEHFLERKRWDFEGTPAGRGPLLLRHHPLELYRHQVIKQTDVVLATYLVSHRFSRQETQRTFDYYDPLTTGDSTLSACIQSVIASAVGYDEAAYAYFLQAANVDLGDTHGNTADGLHIASCGGTWLALVAGFGGLRDFDGRVSLHPRLPREWTHLRFRIEVRGQVIEVDVRPATTTYTLLQGPGLLVWHDDELMRLAPGAPQVRPTVAGSEPEPLARAA